MKPVTVSLAVRHPRDRVFRFLDVLANHEAFTDHMLIDWHSSGPASGVGACARMRVKKPGRPDWLDMCVVRSERPSSTTEEAVSAGGRRRTRGTYLLDELSNGEGTNVSFRFEWLAAPMVERLAAPFTRAVIRRGNIRSLRRLAEQLDHQPR